MSNRMRLLCLGLLLLTQQVSVRADILIGGFGNTTTPQSLLRFADAANGNVAPISTLGGVATAFQTPIAGIYEPLEDVVYVADFYGQSIRVFPVGASGDVAPKRVVGPDYVSQVRSIAVDVTHAELLITSTCCYKVFDRTANGNAFYKRYVQWGGLSGSVTQQNSPAALVYMAPTDEVAETDTDSASPYTPKVLVFNRSDSGNTAPKRVLKGTSTQLGTYAGALAYDASSRKLFIGAFNTNPDSSRSGRILVFDDMDDGNVAPLRSIAGSLTGLELTASGNIAGLAIDPKRQRLLVSVSDYNIAANNKVLEFDLTASGNVLPLQTIAGTLTGFPLSLGTPIWAPDRVFANGFESAP